MNVESQMVSRRPARWVADPALIVLVIFTAVSALVTQPFWSLSIQDEPTSDRPVLHVAADRTVTIDGQRVPPTEVSDRIEALVQGRDDRDVYFEADEDTSYGSAIHVMRLIRDGGGRPLPRLSPGH